MPFSKLSLSSDPGFVDLVATSARHHKHAAGRDDRERVTSGIGRRRLSAGRARTGRRAHYSKLDSSIWSADSEVTRRCPLVTSASVGLHISIAFSVYTR